MDRPAPRGTPVGAVQHHAPPSRVLILHAGCFTFTFRSSSTRCLTRANSYFGQTHTVLEYPDGTPSPIHPTWNSPSRVSASSSPSIHPSDHPSAYPSIHQQLTGARPTPSRHRQGTPDVFSPQRPNQRKPGSGVMAPTHDWLGVSRKYPPDRKAATASTA